MDSRLIYKIVDYILLNAYSMDSSGFYRGKAGVSLALFEASRLLEDDHLEEHAFELLQESLLYKGEDLSFVNGCSGISFVFHYLIDHQFVGGDVDELLGEQEHKVQSTEYEQIISITDVPISTLSACIDRLYLLRCEEERNKDEIEVLESGLVSSSEGELEAKLLKIMSPRGISVGYADGLSRWLLYVVYVESSKRGLDVSRFDSLFKLMPLWKR